MKRNVPTAAERELRDLIRSKLTDGMTADAAADAVFELFPEVTDDWDATDITRREDWPGSRTLDQRWLVVRIPRESRERHLAPDRSVTGNSGSVLCTCPDIDVSAPGEAPGTSTVKGRPDPRCGLHGRTVNP